jgi:hypothetical protein
MSLELISRLCRLIAICLVCTASLMMSGCGGQPVVGPGPTVSTAKATAARDDDLHNGLRYVRLMSEYDYDKASEKALGSLNSWLAASTDNREFKVDPLRAQLPKEIKPFFPGDGLAGNKFRSDDFLFFRQFLPAPATQPAIAEGVRSGDFRYLHESYLFHKIAEWAVKQPSDPQTEAWLDEHAKSLDEKSARKLREVTRLFDWTIRHLQLEPAPPEPPRAASGPTSNGTPERPAFPPALEGKPGPGYLIFPGHLVVAGRADYVQRAWIFCLLARQIECDVVMLAFENAETNRHDPWATGAIIGDQIYLFDTRLGLPIPLDNDQGIATLAQVRENESLLRRLDLSTEMVYPANKDNLKRLVALVEFCDAALSKRMSVLESRLTGEEQMVLAVHPSQIAAAAQKAGVSQVYPWRIAYDTLLFRASMDASLRKDFAFFMKYYTFEMPFISPNLLAKARYKHLGADFTGDGETGGALDTYMDARVSNEMIQRLEETEEGKNLLNMKMMGERELTQADKQQMIAAQKTSMAISKLHASYFMGQAQYDLGAFPLAEEWFQKRNLETNPTGPWTVGAKYGLARSLEMQKKYREAREIYLADQSAQKEGNLLRARRLKALADAQPEAANATEAAPSTDPPKTP